ncbi:Uncharacterized protein KIAA0528-like [Papilio machaon]|uniref:Uncharacterized protein KIAA0528-like n=1 Tax=Papilio machaon TaxID=76193 RepID=A0A0N1PHF9_PAPMA|nr:Uncharacterized protein KIAA0528-like [Papilio machaon]
MPGKIKVKVLAGRNLPVMDRASDTTDAFVEVKFGGVTHKTDVCRKSLNPHWNSTEWYRFEVDESELQDEPLQLRLMDHDTYSANDAIGKVVISLAPLLAREANNAKGTGGPPGGAVMSGWIPVFDTMHGIRGELNVIVKVELFSDFNKYKTSSCGVQFFHCPMIPPGYRATAIHGFVEELIVNDDPEYQWIDKIRTPRASNEARQVAFIKLSNQVQRLVGLKAAELGANAVVGYQQDFDLEGEAGVVARAIGTAVSITPLPTPSHHINIPPCSQQQLMKYLDILATDDESVTDLAEYYQNHQEELLKLVNILNPKAPYLLDDPDTIDEDDKSIELTKESNAKNYVGDRSIYQEDYVSRQSLRHLSEDQTDLNRLLNKASDYDSDSSGPLQKIKKIKTSFFTKRFSGPRSRKTEKQDDQVSIKSNSSDNSRISLTDIKKELKKLKKLKKPKIRKVLNTEEEGIGMASILARSVIHAQTSLACIAESHDSEHSPASTMRQTSESEPTLNVSDDEKVRGDSTHAPVDEAEKDKRIIPDIFCSSLDNIKSIDSEETKEDVTKQRKLSESCPTTPVVVRSDNLLKLPGEGGFYDSISSALSVGSSEYTSSEEDDESFGLKDPNRTIETTSSVVQSVLSHDANPDFIAQMERKLTSLEEKKHNLCDENTDQDNIENKFESDVLKNNVQGEKCKTVKIEKDISNGNIPSTSKADSHKDNKCVPSNAIKMTNPFSHKKASKSISAPSSPVDKKGFVYRSSKRIKRQISKLTKSTMIKSLSHYTLRPKKKHETPKTAMSQPGSASDVTSKAPSETVLGSPFLSYSDLLTLDKEVFELNRLHKSDETGIAKVSMYIGSEPVSRMSFSGPSGCHSKSHSFREQRSRKKEISSIRPAGLVQTAMETILIDRVQSLLIPTSPDPVKNNDKKFFDDVNEKLEQVEVSRKKEEQSKYQTNDIKKQDSAKDKKKLVRQDSVRSTASVTESSKVSKPLDPNHIIPCKLTSAPVLQHFHPILSGGRLESIPSLPETSLDRTESLDVEGVELGATNSASACDLHAACRVDRSERDRGDKERGSPRHARHESYGGRDAAPSAPAPAPAPTPATPAQNVSVHSTSIPVGIHRRSSDSDLSITPKGSSLNASGGNAGGGGAILRPSMNSNNLDMLEYPFLTMTEYPPGFIVHIGGTVCARSVKLVDGGGESASRAAWWAELRTELRAHARALRCTAVLAYCEKAAVREDVCVLSASGTAAVINLDCEFVSDEHPVTVGGVSGVSGVGNKKVIEETEVESCSCSAAHVPYSAGGGPYRAELAACGGCRRARVPSVLLATCAKPAALAAYPTALTLTAVDMKKFRDKRFLLSFSRTRRSSHIKLQNPSAAVNVLSSSLQGANAIFSLQTQIAIGERCVMALASGTAVRLAALPPPTPPTIKASENDKNALEMKRALWDTFQANRTANGYDLGPPEQGFNGAVAESEDLPALELSADKDACVLELDEAEDVETAKLLAVRHTTMQVYTPGLRPAPGAPPHAFMQVWRARLGACGGGERLAGRALSGAAYKLRRLQPAALAPPTFHLDLPEDEIQLVVAGTAIPLAGAGAGAGTGAGSAAGRAGTRHVHDIPSTRTHLHFTYTLHSTTRTHLHVHTYTYTYTPTRSRTHIRIHVHTYTSRTHICIHVHTYTYTPTRTHVLTVTCRKV